MLDNMVVFNKYVMPTVYETLAQEYQKFNAASGGTIRLSAEGFEGNYDQESFYASLAAAQRRVLWGGWCRCHDLWGGGCLQRTGATDVCNVSHGRSSWRR